MSSPDRSAHWRTCLDSVEAVRTRIQAGSDSQEDAVTRQLMAQVVLAKSSNFTALLDSAGNVLDVNPTALITGGVDLSEVVGLLLWVTPWWSGSGADDVAMVSAAVAAAAEGRFA